MWNPIVLKLHTTPNLVVIDGLIPFYFMLTCRLTAAEIRFLRSTKEKNSNRDEDTMMKMLMRWRRWRRRKKKICDIFVNCNWVDTHWQ